MILRVPGDVLPLRVAWIERHDFWTRQTETRFRPKMALAERSHFGGVEVWARKLSSRLAPSVPCVALRMNWLTRSKDP